MAKTNYEYYVGVRNLSTESVKEMFRRWSTRYGHPADETFENVMEFLRGDAYYCLPWKKGDVVRLDAGPLTGHVGVVVFDCFKGGESIRVRTTEGTDVDIPGYNVSRAELPAEIMELARLKLEAEGYAKIKD